MSQPISIDSRELETWLDEFLAEEMPQQHVPGVTLSVVQHGEVSLAKGCGYADIKRQIPVVAESTVFRVGGVSMLLTATAIMQLVEQGLIDLDDDVNRYLANFQLDNSFPQPVTIANLLTHTAGFDYSFIGIGTFDLANLIPPSEYLATKMPPRVRAPGTAVVGGCNYGHGLLGYLIEAIAKVPYTQYIEENILQLLEMKRTSFEPPSPNTLNLASSYQYLEKQGIYRAFDYEHTHLPTASINTTATDLARLAIAHLQDGKFKSSTILAANTVRQMQQQQFTHDARLPGVGLGFWELTPNNNQRILGSGGSISGFNSILFLMPEHSLGVFIAANAGGNILRKFIKQFVDRYFPLTEQDYATLRSLPQDRQNLKRYIGSYRSAGYTKLTLEKITLLFSTSSFRLQLEADGTLSNRRTRDRPNPVYFEETESLVLQVKNSPYSYVLGKADDRGRISNLVLSNAIIDKIAWYETNTSHWFLIVWFVLIFLSGAIVNLAALANFHEDARHQFAGALAGIICSLNLVAGGGMLLLDPLTKQNYRLRWIYGLPSLVPISLSIFLLTSVLAVGLPICAILAWHNHDWSFLGKLHYSLVALTAIGLIPWLNYWNLLGFRYR